VVLGEYDPKPDGKWPGRDGAAKVAADLADRLGRSVFWALPLDSAKDVRGWMRSQGLDHLSPAEQWITAGQRFGGALMVQETKPAKPAVTDWPEPVPLTGCPTVPPFPVDVFPAKLQLFTIQTARALSCPADYVAVPVLAISGTAIGASRALAIKSSHIQRAVL
jgi:hypothetical protein